MTSEEQKKIGNLIDTAMTWNNTPEGLNFWSMASNSLRSPASTPFKETQPISPAKPGVGVRNAEHAKEAYELIKKAKDLPWTPSFLRTVKERLAGHAKLKTSVDDNKLLLLTKRKEKPMKKET